MQDIYIDFSKYSSIKIGSNIKVAVLQTSDFNAKLDCNTHTAREDVGLSFNKKPLFYNNAKLNFDNKIETKKTSYINIDSKCFRIIGRANNLLVSPNANNLAILGNSFNYISSHKDYIEIGASVSSLQAFLFFKKNDLMGLEFLQSLPGNIGALCNMNAGMKQYEISQILMSLNINGEWVDINHAKLHYRGRDSNGVIFAARFYKLKGFRHELLDTFKQMRKTHPHNPSCGSCFKNPPGSYAGKLIEEAGLKGFFINNVGFSDKHANFLVNLGKAEFSDALEVISIAKQEVYKISNISLECEVQICK